jgi:hypothetical protein
MRLWRIARWLLAGGLIAFITWFNWDTIVEASEQSFDFFNLAVAGFLYLPSLILTFYRWYVLVRAQDLPFRELDAFRLGFVGNFFNQFLPGSVGGDLVKAGFLASEQSRRTTAVATVIVDRLVGLYGLLVLASVCGVFFWRQVSDVAALRAIVGFTWAVTGSALVLFFLPLPYDHICNWLQRVPAGRIIAGLIRGVALYRHRLRPLGLAVVLAVIGHIGFVMSYYYSSLAVLPDHHTPSPAEHFLIIPSGMVVQAIPITPGGLGTAEVAFSKLYAMRGSDKGYLTSLAQRVVALSVALLGLIFYIPLRRTVREIIATQTTLPLAPAAEKRHEALSQ